MNVSNTRDLALHLSNTPLKGLFRGRGVDHLCFLLTFCTPIEDNLLHDLVTAETAGSPCKTSHYKFLNMMNQKSPIPWCNRLFAVSSCDPLTGSAHRIRWKTEMQMGNVDGLCEQVHHTFLSCLGHNHRFIKTVYDSLPKEISVRESQIWTHTMSNKVKIDNCHLLVCSMLGSLFVGQVFL